MRAPALGVIADDLTGGAAIAGEIARDRRFAVDIVSLSAFDETSAPAVVIETASRYISAEISMERVFQASERLRDSNYTTVLKKIDSTLKGNVATELRAFARHAAGPVVIAPACPAVGLGLRGGLQMSDGVPGRDLTTLLEGALGHLPIRLDLETVREGSSAIADALSHLDEHSVVLADAVDDRDLAAIAEGAHAAGICSFAGTYGLGAAIAAALGLVSHRDAFPEPGCAQTADRLLFLAGSANPTSAEQIRRLVCGGAQEIVLDVPRFLRDPIRENGRIHAEVISSSAEAIVLHTASDASRDEVSRIQAVNRWSERQLAELIAAPFVNAVEELPDAGIYFLGGETTGAICEQLGWTRFTATDEIAPAIPRLRIAASTHPFALTKPGAFGRPDHLLRAARQHLNSGRL